MRRHDGNKKYDGEVLFRAWCEWGVAATNPRLMKFAEETFGNSSQMGPSYSMWNWAFHNPEKSFELYKEYWFNVNPDKDPLTFPDYLAILRDKGNNKNIGGGRRGLERFCAKYGIPMDFKVEMNDVVQVTRANHPMFQMFAIVDEINDVSVKARYFIPDKVYPEVNGRESVFCELSMRDIGVIGRSIV